MAPTRTCDEQKYLDLAFYTGKSEFADMHQLKQLGLRFTSFPFKAWGTSDLALLKKLLAEYSPVWRPFSPSLGVDPDLLHALVKKRIRELNAPDEYWKNCKCCFGTKNDQFECDCGLKADQRFVCNDAMRT